MPQQSSSSSSTADTMNFVQEECWEYQGATSNYSPAEFDCATAVPGHEERLRYSFEPDNGDRLLLLLWIKSATDLQTVNELEQFTRIQLDPGQPAGPEVNFCQDFRAENPFRQCNEMQTYRLRNTVVYR